MKNNLGKLLILLNLTLLYAGDFEHSMYVDKHTPYLKEAVVLTFDVNQSNHDIVLIFDFDLVKSEDYRFQRVNIKEVEAYHNVQIRYTYLVYPLTEGKIAIDFDLTQRATTDESVAYSFSGDRDNIKGLVTKDTQIEVKPLQLDVKPLPKQTQLVGNFTLDYRVKTHKAEAYAPLPLQVTLTGKGYPPLVKNLLSQEGNFTRFGEAPLVESIATAQGTQSTVVYPMALSHSQSFSLEPIVIHAFNPHTAQSYTLTVPLQKFTIKEVNQTALLDTINTPPLLQMDWSWLENIFGYFIVFVAGYLTAILSQKQTFRWQKSPLSPTKDRVTEDNLDNKIKDTKTHKALLQILIAQEEKKFGSCISKLEAILYGKEKHNSKKYSLHSLKKEALEKLR